MSASLRSLQAIEPTGVTDSRKLQLEHWLEADLEIPIDELKPASEDASFRRYFRLKSATNVWVVMDAPPEKEPLTAFIAVDQFLRDQGVHAPEIIASNLEEGFLLLEDLGNETYLQQLHTNASVLYPPAINTLIQFQWAEKEAIHENIGEYHAAFVGKEMELYVEWYLRKRHSYQLSDDESHIWNQLRECLITAFHQQPQVWVHRDFHCRNLMISNQNLPGVIDFQDMLRGPLLYDIVSLLKDCYIQWPRAQQLQWLHDYFQLVRQHETSLADNWETFVRWYDFTGLQRHLKVMGIFSRLSLRDGKRQYLEDLPRVESYILEVLELYPEFAAFAELFRRFPHTI